MLGLGADRRLGAVGAARDHAGAVFGGAGAVELAAAGAATAGVVQGHALAGGGAAFSVGRTSFGGGAVFFDRDAVAVFGRTLGGIFSNDRLFTVLIRGCDAHAGLRGAVSECGAGAVGFGLVVAGAGAVANRKRGALAGFHDAAALRQTGFGAFCVNRLSQVGAGALVGVAGSQLFAVVRRLAASVGLGDASVADGCAFAVELAGFGARAILVAGRDACAFFVHCALALADALGLALAGMGVVAPRQSQAKQRHPCD
jgi:hypothetical protein